MAKHSAIRIYLKRAEGFSRLLWIQNNRPNEMLLGAYSLDGSPGTITHEFPERRWTPGDPADMTISYGEATAVTMPIDHFTCHADGRFHVKSLGGKPLYSHVEQNAALGPDSPVFLDLGIATDVLGKYKLLSSPPKLPHVWLEAPQDGVIVLNAIFSGARYPILAQVTTDEPNTKGVIVRSGTIQGVIWGNPLPISTDAAATRPPGTLLWFHWKRGGQTVGAKAFIVN